MFADYCLETYDIHTISNETGFITYKVVDTVCRIYDIYIAPAHRSKYNASILGKKVQISALDKGANCLLSQVSETQRDYKHALDIQCTFGFTIIDVRLDSAGKVEYLLHKDLTSLKNFEHTTQGTVNGR